jgi:hypothetical protein
MRSRGSLSKSSVGLHGILITLREEWLDTEPMLEAGR